MRRVQESNLLGAHHHRLRLSGPTSSRSSNSPENECCGRRANRTPSPRAPSPVVGTRSGSPRPPAKGAGRQSPPAPTRIRDSARPCRVHLPPRRASESNRKPEGSHRFPAWPWPSHVRFPLQATRDSNPARLVLETGPRPARCPLWTWPDSNRLLPPCENGALPGELQAQSVVGVEGLEPSTSWSQARRAPTCATRR